jgi:hypothetical protein
MHSKRVVFLLLLIAALTVAACSPKGTPQPTATTEVLTPSSSGGEVAVGFTEDGSPYRGNPDAAVTLIEYSEFL